jgi:hypothetical protein
MQIYLQLFFYFTEVIEFFSFNLFNPSSRTMALGVYPASNRNEYQNSFLR